MTQRPATQGQGQDQDTQARVDALAREARSASLSLAQLSADARSGLLRDLATALSHTTTRDELLAANALDMQAAATAQARGELPQAIVSRLKLSGEKLDGLCEGLRQLAAMPELVGERQLHRRLDEGLVLERRACPLGVLGVVFEARPDAVVQIAGLAIKSGNAVLLKGGSESLASNRALAKVIRRQLDAHQLHTAAVTLLEDRAQFGALLNCVGEVDLIIARGSGKFVQHVMDTTSIPVMGHAEGLCHMYLHADAPVEMAAKLSVDAKASYPSACNSIETLLWHSEASAALDASVEALLAAGVEVRGCERTRARHPSLPAATQEDWKCEYTDLILSVRAVDSLDEALAHIARFGSKHTEAVVCSNEQVAERFLAQVDAAGVFWNASTRFADGFRYGLGAEVGVSTQKLHARGPVGLDGLLTYRYLLRGHGHVSAEYGPAGRAFAHEDLE